MKSPFYARRDIKKVQAETQVRIISQKATCSFYKSISKPESPDS